MKEEDFHQSPLIEKMLKEMPLEVRLKVPLEMSYLNIVLEPDTCCTEEQFNEASKWAQETTEFLLKEVEEWINDGAMLRKESDSLTTPDGE